MPRPKLSNPWPKVDVYDKAGPGMPAGEKMMGHPTSPGLRDAKAPRQLGASPGNGQPGVARLRPGRRPPPGLPPQGPTGPIQPDVIYDGPHED